MLPGTTFSPLAIRRPENQQQTVDSETESQSKTDAQKERVARDSKKEKKSR